MPIVKVPFTPGINREVTNYAGSGGFYDCNKIRFRAGTPEKIGGWINAFAGNTFVGTARNLWNWETTTGENLIAIGSNQKYYVNNGGSYFDITPVNTVVTLTNPFTTTSGSNYVKVTDSTALTVGTFVSFSGATAVGGLTISGSYEIVTVILNGYYILASSNASSTASGGGTVTATYQINAGNSVVSPAVGWGSAPWGYGGWGSNASVSVPLRLWSQANFGDDLLFAARNGALYYWTKDTISYAAGVTINTKASSVTKTTQTVATGVSSSTTFTIINSQSVDIGATVTLVSGAVGSSIPTGTYVTTGYTGYTTVTVSAAVTLSAGDVVAFSYSGKTAPNQVGNVLVSTTNQFTVALGSTPYNPANFNPAFVPLLVRWSDQSVPYDWTPTTANQSGEQSLSAGSYIVTGLSTRQEILVWTDRALFSMQYIGPPLIFSFQLMMDNISIISPNAMISVNGQTYWMGQDKFYMYNGTVSPLPCSVRKYVFSNINYNETYQIVCGQNEQFNEVWWFYPSTNSSVNDSYVVYNYLENSWYYGTINRTGWLQSSLQSYPLGIYSVQNSYLAAPINASATVVPLLNAASYPSSGCVQIGSEQITYSGVTSTSLTGCTRGANGTVAASHTIYTAVINLTPNQILYHEYGVDDYSQNPTVPQPISAYLQTSDFDIGQGGDHFGYVWRILPDFTFQGSNSSNPTLTVTINPRTNSGTAYTTGNGVDSPSVVNTVPAPTPPNTYPVEQYTGQIYTRIRGRQMNLYVQSNTVGVAWQMGQMRLDTRPDGRRA